MVARYAEDPLNHEALARWNVLGPLLSVLACGSPVAQAAACEALVYLSGNAVLKNDLADDDRYVATVLSLEGVGGWRLLLLPACLPACLPAFRWSLAN